MSTLQLKAIAMAFKHVQDKCFNKADNYYLKQNYINSFSFLCLNY